MDNPGGISVLQAEVRRLQAVVEAEKAVTRNYWREICWLRGQYAMLGPNSSDRNVEVLQADVAALLTALELPDHARPYSCHETIHQDILPVLRKMVAANKRVGLDEESRCRRCGVKVEPKAGELEKENKQLKLEIEQLRGQVTDLGGANGWRPTVQLLENTVLTLVREKRLLREEHDRLLAAVMALQALR
jgi:hypothetical protein